jgi:hypothetical protein
MSAALRRYGRESVRERVACKQTQNMFAVSLYHGESVQVSAYFAFYISNRVCEWWVVEADAYVFGAGLATHLLF